MKKRVRGILACTLALILCLVCIPTVSASASGVAYQTKQMGQVTVHFRGLAPGVESFSYHINLNGYVPKTISSTISGDFTESKLQDTAYGLLPIPMMNTANVSSAEEITSALNGKGVDVYLHNLYESNRTLTSVEYSLLAPGNKQWNGLSFQAPTLCVRYGDDQPFIKTTHKIYMDGQLILEYTCQVSSNGSSSIPSYKIYDANFQTPTAQRSGAQVAVEPTTSKIYVDGKQVELGAYLIDGSNYMRLRDIAYVLMGTNAEFDVAWHQDKNMVELLPGEKYSIQGGELAKLSPANATVSTSQVTSKITNIIGTVSQEYFSPTAYNVGGNNFYKLRDVAHMAGFSVSWDASTKSVHITTKK